VKPSREIALAYVELAKCNNGSWFKKGSDVKESNSLKAQISFYKHVLDEFQLLYSDFEKIFVETNNKHKVFFNN
jgi:hypothetical protein